MTDDELSAALARLGIGPGSARAVLLLPLVQVAWADGRVQGPERDRIREIAVAHGLGGDPAWQRWLEARPDDDTLRLGREVMVALALRHRGDDPAFRPEVLDDVVQWSLDVARAAGGLFGLLFSVDERERRALDEIGAALRAARDRQADELPDPDGGRFEEL